MDVMEGMEKEGLGQIFLLLEVEVDLISIVLL